MAVSISVQVSFATIEAIQDDEGITQALQKLAVNPGAPSKVLHNIVANVVKAVEELPYLVTAKQPIPSKTSTSELDPECISRSPERGYDGSRASSPSFGARSIKSRTKSADLNDRNRSPSIITPPSQVESCGGWDIQSDLSSRAEVPRNIVVTMSPDGWSGSKFTLKANEPFNRLVELYRQRQGTPKHCLIVKTTAGRVIKHADRQKPLDTLGIKHGAFLIASKTFDFDISACYQPLDISVRDLMGRQHDLCFDAMDTYEDLVDCYKRQAGCEQIELDFFRVDDGVEKKIGQFADDLHLKELFEDGQLIFCKPKTLPLITIAVRNAMDQVTCLSVNSTITMAELDKVYRNSKDDLLPSLVYHVFGEEYSTNTKGWTVTDLKDIAFEDCDEITVWPDKKSTRPGSAWGHAASSSSSQPHSPARGEVGWNNGNLCRSGWD